MKVSELLEARRVYWRELEQMCTMMEGRSRRKIPPQTVARFSALYRAACADLALADAYQFPPGTIHYLHQLVARAHNQLYRARTFNLRAWFHQLFVEVPQRLFGDNCLRLAFAVFWGVFVLSAAMAYRTPGYAERMMTKEGLAQIEESFAEPPTGRDANAGSAMAGFYTLNNPSIGMKCFAFGLLFGVGGLYETLFNAGVIGAIFGHMARSPNADNFFQFVTAHGPFELTAVVLCAAAGMRLGFSLISTGGYTRAASLRRAAGQAMPTVGAAIVLFLLAAGIEAFVSPSSAPYWFKALVGVLSASLLMFYFVFLGYPKESY
jgi:uncharacterized membrane protein SpoIIM required for sporulation